MEKPIRPQRNRRHSRRAWPPEDDLHYPRAAKRLFTPEIKRMLKEWLVRRRENPYPSREEKKRLAIDTGLTYTQICNWFANWRRKLKNAEREKSKKSWGHLIKNYNTNAKGNVEQFSISSEDSIWEEEEQFRRNHSDEEEENDSMCDIEGSSGSTDNAEPPNASSGSSSREQYRNASLKRDYKPNVYMGNMTLHKDHNDLFIGREVDVLTTNATCQITQSAANIGTKTKYKQKMMEKYLRDTYDGSEETPAMASAATYIQAYHAETPNSEHATVFCNASNTTIIKSGAELSKWLESAAKFTPNKNNYFIEWNNKRNKSDKKPFMGKSFPSPTGNEQHSTSLTVVPLLYSTTATTTRPVVQIQNSPNIPQAHHYPEPPQKQLQNTHLGSLESDHIYNTIHHKDELDAAEALANLAFNCRQRMMDSNINARVNFQRPLNAISS
ncbi:iroquois-class homeodomain protein IRX-1 [Stomoxys calcitrans]|uniref:iroquois-class homeodomain protein IRX-1 n=1 Tax=Stomoxys calcitrans TaxID=35570 RepID=UPI0027E23EA6|nr:iroquois-class homeodomain protein IRX-1 [Stomoxys calcitrans]XP_013107262.2 iroquois-class homeodomain protein IRX-1 [Stomoxys calcitrans]